MRSSSARKRAWHSRIRPVPACIIALACTAFANPVHAQVCGNGVREAGEECDDGNRASLDGCSANCRFEQTQRMNKLALMTTLAPAALGCSPATNAFGTKAVSPNYAGALNSVIGASIADGSTSLLMYFAHGLDSATGTGTNLQIGIFNAAPSGVNANYDGTNDVDWWYDIDDAELRSAQQPASIAGGYITAKVFYTPAPVSFLLRTDLGAPAELSMSAARILFQTGTASTPMPYAGSDDRGHLASENLDPALQSFATTVGNQTGQGLCGRINAASFAHTAVPAALLTGGNTACSQGFTANNSYLDVLVTGCTFLGIATLVIATQPDTTDPNAPVAGGGGPYKLTTNASHVVDACADSNNTAVDLAACLNAAAYSSYFTFTTDRVIAKSAGAADVIFHDQFDVFP